MRKLIVFGALLALTAALIGCGKKSAGESGSDNDSASGNPYEKMVQEFCAAAQKFSSALGMCDDHLLRQLNMREGALVLQGSTGGDMSSDAHAFFAALSKAKDPVKTEVVKTLDLKVEGGQGAFIAATCGDVTIYFGVGETVSKSSDRGEKKEMKIAIIMNKEELEKRIREIEEFEKMIKEAERTGRKRGGDDSDVQAAKNEAARELIKNVEIALKAYNMKRGKYPDSLDALTDDSDSLLKGEPVDPWGNELMYEKLGKKLPIIRSAGPDGEFGTDDDLANQKAAFFEEEDEERTKAKDAVESLDEGKIKRLGE